jgi:hypothetical protein
MALEQSPEAAVGGELLLRDGTPRPEDGIEQGEAWPFENSGRSLLGFSGEPLLGFSGEPKSWCRYLVISTAMRSAADIDDVGLAGARGGAGAHGIDA